MNGMKKILIILCAILTVNMLAAQNIPDWVKTHPVSEKEYTGVGMCPVSDPQHVQKATQNALADMASQISLKLENNSLLHLIDVDGKAREMLEDKIKTSIGAWIEGQELKGSYSDGNFYYVYYTLNKKDHAKNAERKKSNAILAGSDFLKKGRAAEGAMNLPQAAQLYAKGLEAVEAWAFMELTTDIDGVKTNIPGELYSLYVNVFSNMAITTNAAQLEGEPFCAVNIPVAACLSKNGVVIPNMKLKAEFVSGSGLISDATETDYNGTAEFYITNITSKEKVQEIRVSIDDKFMENIPASYRSLIQQKGWPMAKVMVVLKDSPAKCYFKVEEGSTLEGIEKNIISLLNNNYFTMVENPYDAEYCIDLSTKREKGEVITSGTYNVVSNYCSLVMKIYNSSKDKTLLTYSVNQVKVLVPEHKTDNETVAQCNREVMKRVNRELPAQLKKLNNN